MRSDLSGSARFELEEKLRVAEAFQRELVEKGIVPDTRKLMIRRMRVFLEILGGMILGVFSSVLAVLVTFVVFNKVFHI